MANINTERLYRAIETGGSVRLPDGSGVLTNKEQLDRALEEGAFDAPGSDSPAATPNAAKGIPGIMSEIQKLSAQPADNTALIAALDRNTSAIEKMAALMESVGTANAENEFDSTEKIGEATGEPRVGTTVPVGETGTLTVTEGPFAPDFPGAKHLQSAGLNTLADVRKLSRKQLVALQGIGEATAKLFLELGAKVM
ncbi:MAG: hypothetical protein V4671_18175, partial [Armatimonadota bacterium]